MLYRFFIAVIICILYLPALSQESADSTSARTIPGKYFGVVPNKLSGGENTSRIPKNTLEKLFFHT